MAFMPPTIAAVRLFLAEQTGRELKYFSVARGDYSKPSYHLGGDQIKKSGRTSANDYTIRTARDKAGLSDARSAIDINLGDKQEKALFAFLLERCRANAPGTSDIREVIGTLDGKTVLRWDRERGVNSAPRPGEADNSHLWHIHMSWYRDSEKRDKVGVFRPFFGSPPPPSGETTVTAEQVKLLQTVLKALGFDPGPVDGIFGGRTQAALGAALDGASGLVTGKAELEAALAAATAKIEAVKRAVG